MLRLFRWVVRRARRSPNSYAILAGIFLAVGLPMYGVLIAAKAHEPPVGIAAVDAIREVSGMLFAKIEVPLILISVVAGLPLIFLGVSRAFGSRDVRK